MTLHLQRDVTALEVVVRHAVVFLDHRTDGWRASSGQQGGVVTPHRPCVSARLALSAIGIDATEAWAVEFAADAERQLDEGSTVAPVLTTAAFIDGLRRAGVWA